MLSPCSGRPSSFQYLMVQLKGTLKENLIPATGFQYLMVQLKVF